MAQTAPAATVAVNQAAAQVSTSDAPVEVQDAVLAEQLLVEDVSIDGMCGVY